MILFWDGSRFPFEVQLGDVLFIAGCLNAGPIPWEHVAVAAEGKSITGPGDLLALRTYGLPESAVPGQNGLQLSDGRWWVGRDPVATGQIGSKQTAWNIGGRRDGMDAEKAQFLAHTVDFIRGSVEVRYSGQCRISAIFSNPFETNCVGFVCSLFEHLVLPIVHADFPKYQSPYTKYPGSRDYPSPGHLAHALERCTYSYRASDSAEAARYAPAAETLREKVCPVIV
jgi:hypothetical protein